MEEARGVSPGVCPDKKTEATRTPRAAGLLDPLSRQAGPNRLSGNSPRQGAWVGIADLGAVLAHRALQIGPACRPGGLADGPWRTRLGLSNLTCLNNQKKLRLAANYFVHLPCFFAW